LLKENHMRVTETRQLFEQACEYPVDHETLIENVGTVPLEAPTGDRTAMSTIFARSGQTTYHSADEAFQALVGNVDDSFVGRKYYDDRGGSAGGPHTDADNVSL
jgi:hypothetical protein